MESCSQAHTHLCVGRGLLLCEYSLLCVYTGSRGSLYNTHVCKGRSDHFLSGSGTPSSPPPGAGYWVILSAQMRKGGPREVGWDQQTVPVRAHRATPLTVGSLPFRCAWAGWTKPQSRRVSRLASVLSSSQGHRHTLPRCSLPPSVRPSISPRP